MLEMMVSKKEKTQIHRFVCDQLRDEEDLSSLTLGILKKRYLLLMKCDSLSSEAKCFMKQVVGEELMKMKESDDNSEEVETERPRNKRKREEENGSDEEISGRKDETESRAKKPHREPRSSPESDDKKDRKAESEEEEDHGSGPEEVKKISGSSKAQTDSEESSDEEMNESGKKETESEDSECPEETDEKKEETRVNGKSGRGETSPGKKTPQSSEEKDSESEKSTASGKDGTAPVEKKKQDSGSSSLSSSSEDEGNREDDKKRKETKKEKSAGGQRNQEKNVTRLKRYIALCGVRQNYKKLLDGRVSARSQVAALKKELEKLGVHGRPSVKKCEKARMKREQAQELAELDTKNIITTEGRPKRRGAWQKPPSPSASPHVRSLHSSSDSDEENNRHKAGRRAPDWTRLKGVVSDDGDSD